MIHIFVLVLLDGNLFFALSQANVIRTGNTSVRNILFTCCVRCLLSVLRTRPLCNSIRSGFELHPLWPSILHSALFELHPLWQLRAKVRERTALLFAIASGCQVKQKYINAVGIEGSSSSLRRQKTPQHPLDRQRGKRFQRMAGFGLQRWCRRSELDIEGNGKRRQEH